MKLMKLANQAADVVLKKHAPKAKAKEGSPAEEKAESPAKEAAEQAKPKKKNPFIKA